MARQHTWQFFGLLQFSQPERWAYNLHSRKAVALLAYMLVQNTALSRIHLAAILWPDLSEPRALSNLSWTLSHLSRTLPACIWGDRTTLCFHPPASIQIDVLTFRDLLAQATPKSLAAAVDLYRGEFLQGFKLRGCREFEIWLLGERERWRQLVCQTLDTLIKHEIAGCAYPQALTYARRLLRLDPYHEAAHSTIMRVMVLSGQRRAALAQYQAYHRLLSTELNVEPSSELTELYQQIRSNSFPGRSWRTEGSPELISGSSREDTLHSGSSWAQLAPPITPLVGRAALLAQLCSTLSNPDCRLLTLTGPGGIGKTRLALQLAEQLGAMFRDGVFIVSLTTATTVTDLCHAVAHTINLSWNGPVDLQSLLLQTMAPRELLLILDDFEHLVQESAFLLELLNESPQLKIVITSRERLNVQLEQVCVVPGLGLPEERSGADPTSAGSVQLFLERARRVDDRLHLVKDCLTEVVQLCRLLEGNPLAIELAAACSAQFAPGQIIQAIQTDLDRLTTTLHDVPDRHRNMRAVFESSWTRLSKREQQILAQLSIFRGSFNTVAVHEVTEASNADLVALDQKSLLQRSASGTYQLHGVVRHYARLQLMSDPEVLMRVARQHCLYYLALTEQNEPVLRGARQGDQVRQLDQVLGDLRAALQWCLESGETELGMRLVIALARFWNLRGLVAEEEQWLERLMSGAGPVMGPMRAKALERSGRCAMIRGEYAVASTRYQESLALYQASGHQPGVATIFVLLGGLSWFQGQFSEADTFFREGLIRCREIGDHWGVINSLSFLAALAVEKRNFAQAQVYYAEVASMSQQVEDPLTWGWILNNWGLTYVNQGDYAQATRLLEQSLSLFQGLHYPLGISEALRNLGTVAVEQQDLSQASMCFLESLQISQIVGERRGIAECLLGLAASVQIEHPQHAARWCGAATALYDTIGAGMSGHERRRYAQIATYLCQALSERGFIAHEMQGRMMPFDLIVREAFDTIQPSLVLDCLPG